MRHNYQTRDVYVSTSPKAAIVRGNPLADGYRSAEPWLLLHNSGRVDRFATYTEARDEAIKSYAGARITRRK